MRLLESQKRRNHRLFGHGFLMALQALSHVENSEANYRAVSAWLAGGSLAAELAVDGSDLLKRVWGRGDERKAAALIEVFTLFMIPRWYWNIDRQVDVTSEKKELARAVAASNILTLFGHVSDRGESDILNIDMQFNWQRDWIQDQTRSGSPLEEEILLLSKALTACGYPSRLDWTNLRFPLRDVDDLAAQGGEPDSDNVFDFMAIFQSLIAGEGAMYDYYRGSAGQARLLGFEP